MPKTGNNQELLINALQKAVGSRHVLVQDYQRHLYANDSFPKQLILKKNTALLPDLICQPGNTEEVSKVVRIAQEFHVPMIPFGAGSGVCGGTLPIAGGLIIDLKRLNQIVELTQDTVTVQPGMIGMNLEEILQARGYTLGHFPSSILCASVGGYLAARSAGQFSSKYGKIEDMVLDMEAVLPDGKILPFGARFKKYGNIPTKDLLVGSEGCLGMITKAKFRLHPKPLHLEMRGVSFNKLPQALEAMRLIMQEELTPSVVRLYDPLDSMILQYGYEGNSHVGPVEKIFAPVFQKFSPALRFLKKRGLRYLVNNPYWIQKGIDHCPTEVILILGFEGSERMSRERLRKSLKICKRSISRDLGPKPGEHWLKHRYSVSFKMTRLFQAGFFVDTVEVATTWTQLETLYKTMREELSRHVLVLAHFSHTYHEGCSIYFTIVGHGATEGEALDVYEKAWETAMKTCLKVGGTISHHHGIGLLKAPYMSQELGNGMKLFRALKKDLDPHNLMNPGKMGL